MKIETTTRDDHQVRIVAEFEPEFMEKFKRQAARKISQEARIPGFRPGKAPYDIVRRLYGEEMIDKEAVELMLDGVYPDVLKEASIEPSGPGNLEEVISYNPPKFAFVVPLMPKIELGDFHAIRKDYIQPEVTEDQVDQVIKNLRGNYSTAEPVERPAQEGDLVSVKITGDLAHPDEGEDVVIFKENSYQMIIGENEFEEDDWPYVGFTRELVGMNNGEEKILSHTYPEDYDDEKLHGKEVSLKASIISVKSLHLPEMNDEFVQTLGDYGDVAGLRKSIRQNLTETNERDYDNNYYSDLIDQVIAISDIKYPPQMLTEEIERVIHSLEHDLQDRKMDLPTYLKTLNKEKDAFIEEDIKPVAKRRLERSLVMDMVASSEHIRLNPEELQHEVEETMQALKTDPEVSKLHGAQAQNFAQGLTMETATRILNREVMQRLKAIATGQADQPAEPAAEVAPTGLALEPAQAVALAEPASETAAEVAPTELALEPAAEVALAEPASETTAEVPQSEVETSARQVENGEVLSEEKPAETPAADDLTQA